MATLAQIRTAVKTTVEANITGLKVYPRLPGSATSRALIVEPVAPFDFTVAMGRGTDVYQFNLVVVIANTDLDLAQQILDGYIDGGGADSVRKVIFNNRDLGLTDVDAHVSSLVAYGSIDNAGYDNVSATLRLVVSTRPS